MAIREKLKAKFGRNKTSSGDTTPSTDGSEIHYTGRTDIEYYKPHEIPKSKYRGQVDKAHQESLGSYSFMDAFQSVRRKSSTAFSGTFSPGGTKAQSAAASRAPSVAQSRRASWMSRTRSSMSSAGDTDSPAMDDIPRRKSVGVIKPPHIRNISENSEDDTDVANAGLSRTATAKDVPNIDQYSGAIPQIRLDREATVTQQAPSHRSQSSNTPFTVEELEQAMSKHALAGSRNGMFQPESVAAC